jgi:hypothetical protein
MRGRVARWAPLRVGTGGLRWLGSALPTAKLQEGTCRPGHLQLAFLPQTFQSCLDLANSRAMPPGIASPLPDVPRRGGQVLPLRPHPEGGALQHRAAVRPAMHQPAWLRPPRVPPPLL